MPDVLSRLIKKMFAPIVVFKGYEDMVTEEMKTRIMAERLKNNDDTATDYEAMVYLHTASLAVPLSEDWYNVYTYLFSKYYPEKAKRIGVYKKSLTKAEERELEDLKKWIYEQPMKEG